MSITIIKSTSYDALWYHMSDELITIQRGLIVIEISQQRSVNVKWVKIEL